MSRRISIDGKLVDEPFDSQSKQSLLEFLEQHDLEVHYHCRDGFCGACRLKLNSGDVEYHRGEPLAFIRPGEILACCCRPKSDIDISLE